MNTTEILSEMPAAPATASASDLVSQVAAANELAQNPEVVREIKKYGKTPVIYAPTRAMVKRPADPGLSHLIGNAMTVNEVNNLLKKGKEDYKNAQPKTVRKWEKAAAARIAQLK